MDNKLVDIIKEIAKEEKLSIKQVKHVILNASQWTRTTLIDMQYPAVFWPKLGSFEMLKSKCTSEEEIKKLEEFKTNFKKPKKDGVR